MKPHNVLQLLAATAVLLSGVSCKNRKQTEDLANAAGYGNSSGSYDYDSSGGVSGAGGYDQYGSGANISLPSRSGGSSYYNASKGQFEPVYFAFDSFGVSAAEMGKIREVAAYAKRNGTELIVAGFTDAVGTEEYNRGLGDRRALAVRSALLQAGISASRMQTVSFGEEMLADSSNPSGGRNRRVEFGVVR